MRRLLTTTTPEEVAKPLNRVRSVVMISKHIEVLTSHDSGTKTLSDSGSTWAWFDV